MSDGTDYLLRQAFRKIALRVRRFPVLRDVDLLWNMLRKPYHRILGFGGRGMKFVVGGKVTIRIPPAFSSWEIETYEPEAIGALIEWLRIHPGGLFIDVGNAIGIFSATAMFFDKTSEVIAFDADINSTAAVYRFCHMQARQLD